MPGASGRKSFFRLVEARLRGLDHGVIALPALVLELEVLDGDRIGVGVQIGQRLILRRPAAEYLIRDDELAGLVEELDDDVLAEVLEGNLASKTAAEVPHLVGPLLEFMIVGDA